MADYQLRGIPDDLHRRVRIGTVARGTSIRQVLLDALIRFDREFTEDSSARIGKKVVEDATATLECGHTIAVPSPSPKVGELTLCPKCFVESIGTAEDS